MSIKRRDFIKSGTAAALLSQLLGPELWAQATESGKPNRNPLPHRTLGKTGESLSVIGYGGIVAIRPEQKDVNAYVAELIDRNLNYFDVAPTYGKGVAEKKLGIALKSHRDKAFLACKTKKRDKAGAMQELEKSLKALQTDHFDLYQLHSIRNVQQDVEAAFSEDGAIAALLEAKQSGKIRYIGFSSHSIDAALRAMELGEFDTILHPVNFSSHLNAQFDIKPIEEAKRQKMGLLALKSMAWSQWPKDVKWRDRKHHTWYAPVDDPAMAALAIRWTLSQDITAAIPPGDPDLFKIAVNVAALEKPLVEKEKEALAALASKRKPLFPL